MDPTFALTLLGLPLAVLALLPIGRLAEFRLYAGRPAEVALIASVLVALLLLFTPLWIGLGLPTLGPWQFGLTAELALLLCVVTTIGVGLAGFHRRNFYARDVQMLSTIVRRLLRRREFDRLALLLEWAWPRLLAAAELPGTCAQPGARWSQIIAEDTKVTANRSGRGSQLVRAAETAIAMVMQDRAFAEWCARTDPALAVNLADTPRQSAFQFVDWILVEWMTGERRLLATELARSDNLTGPLRGRRIDDGATILQFCFGDPRVGERLQVWKPVGDALLASLERERIGAASARSCIAPEFSAPKPLDDGDPLFAAISFFEIMIQRAIEADIRWHMWLPYYLHFAKAIRACAEGHTRSGSEGRHTRYEQALSDMLSVVRGIAALGCSEHAAHYRTLQLPVTDNEANGSILAVAIELVGTLMEEVLACRSLSRSFQSEMLSSVVRLYVDASHPGVREALRSGLLGASTRIRRTREAAVIESIQACRDSVESDVRWNRDAKALLDAWSQ